MEKHILLFGQEKARHEFYLNITKNTLSQSEKQTVEFGKKSKLIGQHRFTYFPKMNVEPTFVGKYAEGIIIIVSKDDLNQNHQLIHNIEGFIHKFKQGFKTKIYLLSKTVTDEQLLILSQWMNKKLNETQQIVWKKSQVCSWLEDEGIDYSHALQWFNQEVQLKFKTRNKDQTFIQMVRMKKRQSAETMIEDSQCGIMVPKKSKKERKNSLRLPQICWLCTIM